MLTRTVLASPFRMVLHKQFYQPFQITSAIDLGPAEPTVFTVEIHHVSNFTGTALKNLSAKSILQYPSSELSTLRTL